MGEKKESGQQGQLGFESHKGKLKNFKSQSLSYCLILYPPKI